MLIFATLKQLKVERTTEKTATRPMMVEVELSKEMVEAIAEVQSRHNGYDRLSACDNDLNEMYSTAFYDGMMHLAKLLKIEIK